MKYRSVTDKWDAVIVVHAIAWIVALYGLGTLLATLNQQFVIHYGLHFHLRRLELDVPLLLGITLLYVSVLLRRRKQTAWFVTLLIFSLIVVANLLRRLSVGHLPAGHRYIWNLVLPLLILLALLAARKYYTVKSDIQTFQQSLRLSLLVLVVAFSYGVGGFMLMDKHDFHHEIGLSSAIHHTIDQFGLTTNDTLQPYTRRAQYFIDSLSVVSVIAVAYVLLSLFQPLKARFADQSHNREHMRHLLEHYPATSEDFFKLWPPDKLYYFDPTQTAGLALRVHRGVALVVGDPAGNPQQFGSLLDNFLLLCESNDWTPAFIHTEAKYSSLYEKDGFSLQKIGQEAIVDIEKYQTTVVNDKYFRHIRNKFTKQGYVPELLLPPQHKAVLDRLHDISNDWLKQPGREERGFMLGYFDPNYLEACPIMVVRDAAGTIQAFMNQIPSFDQHEANFDLLRHTHNSPGNINDFLLMNFIDYVGKQGFVRLNLGLCPLVGLDNKEENHSIIDSALRFAYANGDRFYSFSGLERFKSKYEPAWSDRYIAYQGGIRGFTRTLTALNKAMRLRLKNLPHLRTPSSG